MIYNQKRHIELLKRSEDLKTQVKHFFFENRKEYSELSKYNIVVEQHFFRQDRYQVVLLIKNFLNEKIEDEFFYDQAYGLRYRLIRICEKFKFELISSTEKMKEFQPDQRGKS